jgi:hypothetical protein
MNSYPQINADFQEMNTDRKVRIERDDPEPRFTSCPSTYLRSSIFHPRSSADQEDIQERLSVDGEQAPRGLAAWYDPERTHLGVDALNLRADRGDAFFA